MPTFHPNVPLSPVVARSLLDPSSQPPLPAPAPVVPASSVPSRAVLLVDDETAYLDLLEQLMSEHLSCQVHSFKSAGDALKALETLRVGFIVTDYHMPDMDGFEFLKAVQRLHPELPSVMITGHNIELTPEITTRLPGLKAVVKKPFRWRVLADAIALHWDGSRPPFPP
jgi:DNA-binding NtrC family response regulator